MNALTIGKSSKSVGRQLDSLRERLMNRGHKASMHDSPGAYAEAAEMAITAVFESIPKIVDDAFDVLDNPPSTWDHYLAMHDGKHIYEMEFGELREAVKRDLHSGSSELHVHKELTHVMAAAIYMALIDND